MSNQRDLTMSLLKVNVTVLSVKLSLLLSYVILFFFVARLHDLIATWCERSPSPHELLSSLSVGELKELLEQRGVAHETAVEKADLVQLVQGSGPVTAVEVDSLRRPDEDAAQDTLFTSSLHFYQQVEMTWDCAWLVMVTAPDAVSNSCGSTTVQTPLVDSTWLALRQRVSRLGVCTGILDCRLASKLCVKRKWDSNRLLLSLPEANSKTPQAFTYSGAFTKRLVYRWLVKKLQGNLWKVTRLQELRKNWLTFESPLLQPEMHVVLLTNKTAAPPFFAALGAQFSETAKFAWADTQSLGLTHWTKELDIETEMSLPVVLVVSNGGVYVYGQSSAECFTYGCIRTFLYHFRPSQNFGFNASFTVAILLAVLDVFIYKKERVKRVLLGTLINCAVAIVIWLAFSFDDAPIIRFANTQVVKVVRFMAVTSVGAMIRYEVVHFSRRLLILLLSLLAFIPVTKILTRSLIGGKLVEEENEADEEGKYTTNSNHEADREWRAGTEERETKFETDPNMPTWREDPSSIRHGGLERELQF